MILAQLSVLMWSIAIPAALFCFVIVHVYCIRPWCMRLGATQEEARRQWPGDELIPCPKSYATHCITIDATPSEIWPWLIQIGQDRAGFYSFDWLENLFGFDMHNADQIVDGWQELNVEDGVKLHHSATPLSIVRLEPERALVLAGGTELQPDTDVSDPSAMKLHTYTRYTWGLFLEPIDEVSTRFVARIRATWKRKMGYFIHNWFFMEPAHLIMQRGMNVGLKKRVELEVKKAAANAALGKPGFGDVRDRS